MGVSFQKAATKIFQSLSNAPMTVIRGPAQAERAVVAAETIFWGLSASGGLCCEEFQGHTAVP